MKHQQSFGGTALTPATTKTGAGVRIERVGYCAHVILQQSSKFNAMSRAMWKSLRAAFDELALQDDLRCIVVRGDGGNFCAGGDIAEYPGFRFDPTQLRDFHEETVWGALQAMLGCDVPVLAQIEGNCMGAGLEIASCCDIRIAGESARFGAPIARLGFPMAPRELDLVLAQVGATAARQMLLEATVFDAPRMLQLGFLSQVVPDAQLDSLAGQAQQRICALAPLAARANKRSMRALLQPTPEGSDAGRKPERQRVLETLLANAYDYADSHEHHEGIAAFIAKRKPVF